MGAVFAAAARGPLTSLASVLEMSGDFSLTLPVMLAVAIASTVSRALSYGTIYTTKLLRRGIDIDRQAEDGAATEQQQPAAGEQAGVDHPGQPGVSRVLDDLLVAGPPQQDEAPDGGAVPLGRG
jgi:hypothetical protein